MTAGQVAVQMRLPDAMRNLILRLAPWYHADEVEARHAKARKTLRDADRLLNLVESYQAADDRIGRMSGR